MKTEEKKQTNEGQETGNLGCVRICPIKRGFPTSYLAWMNIEVVFAIRGKKALRCAPKHVFRGITEKQKEKRAEIGMGGQAVSPFDRIHLARKNQNS